MEGAPDPAEGLVTGSRTTSTFVALIATVASVATGLVLLSATPGTAAAVSCDPAALVAALDAVSGSGQSGTITLSPGCTYAMAQVNNDADGANAFPDVLGNVTLVGNGATIARSSAATQPFRFFLVDDGGSLTISDLTFTGGTVPAGDTHGGGAIMNRSLLSVSNVTFTGNQSLADTGGGAIDNHDYGRLVVTASAFDHNVGLQGGAIENEATYCHASEPVCASATVSDSSFVDNATTTYGGGGFEGQHGQSGIAVCGPSWPQASMCQLPGGSRNTLAGDTFSGNSAMTEGGGLASFGTTTIRDSTFTGNTISGTGPQGDLGGGGIQSTGVLTLTQTTLAGDRSAHGAELHAYDVRYLSTDPTPQATVSQSILAGADEDSCGGTGTIIDGGYNLDDHASCPFSPSHGSLPSTSPDLGSLSDNGGPTPTMALLDGSPAIDAIPASAPGCSGGTDQRGVTRPQGSGCDIGAYEAGGTPPTPSPTPSPPPSSSPTPSPPPSSSPTPSPSPSQTWSSTSTSTPASTSTPPPSPTGSGGPPSGGPDSSPPAAPPPPGASPEPQTGSGVAVGTAGAIPAANAAGVTSGRDVLRVRTSDGIVLVVRPGGTITIRFIGQRIELQFLGDHRSGWIRVTLGRAHHDINLHSARSRRWRFTFRAAGTGTHVLRIVDLSADHTHPHSGPALLSRIHVLQAESHSTARAI